MQGISIFILSILAGVLLLTIPVSAQTYDDNYDPARSNVTFSPPGNNPTEGLPPPIGGGSSNPTVTPGDSLSSKPPVPSGMKSTVPQTGTYFQTQPENLRPRINILVSRGSQTVNNMSVNRGTRVALTIQPDQLTSSQQSQIAGLLNLSSSGLFTSEPYQNITVSPQTLASIEQALYPPAQPSGTVYPYPGTPSQGDTLRNTPWQNRSYIAMDSPAPGYPRYSNSTMPSILKQGIRDFSLYLVIFGVVIACVQIVFAGAMMAFGHPYAGNKAIASIGGLMLLLMAFTIWKLDMLHLLNARGGPQSSTEPDAFDIRNPRVDAIDQVTGVPRYAGDNTLSQDKKSAGTQSADNPDANLPVTPAPGTGQGQPRSGLPLLPLGSRH